MVMLPAICKLTSGNLRFTSFPLSQLAVPGSPNLALVIALLLQLAIVLPILLPPPGYCSAARRRQTRALSANHRQPASTQSQRAAQYGKDLGRDVSWSS